ncbi:MAG: hypothetical protein KJ737_19110 [Proteobacteria bacterium]|nr:hypothetical protein [Pseudomonadota bacterium]
MKLTLQRKINYNDIDRYYDLKIGAMIRMLQEAAVLHSEEAGVASYQLHEQGVSWILNRIRLDIHRYPKLGEEIIISTWSRGIKGYKAFRDYEIFCHNEKMASISSIWLLFNKNQCRIMKIPEDISSCYDMISEKACEFDLDTWKPDKKFEPDLTHDITTRIGDYDTNGHVNNAVYFDFIETLFAPYMTNGRRIFSMNLFFSKEIGSDVSLVSTGSKSGEPGDTHFFKLFGPDILFACGEAFFKKNFKVI